MLVFIRNYIQMLFMCILVLWQGSCAFADRSSNEAGQSALILSILGGNSNSDGRLPTMPILIRAVEPQERASDVPINNTVLTITFSNPMDQKTIGPDALTVHNSTTNENIPGKVEYDSAENKLTLAISGTLEYGTSYNAVLAESVKNTSGIGVNEAWSWSFTTSPEPIQPYVAPVGQHPVVMASTPEDKEIDIITVLTIFSLSIGTVTIYGMAIL